MGLDDTTASALIHDLALGGPVCERAAERLHHLLVPPLRGYFVRRYRANEADAEDAASAAVLHVFELAITERKATLPDRSAAGWLWKTAHNAGGDELRKIWRRRGAERNLPAVGADANGVGDDGDVAAGHTQDAAESGPRDPADLTVRAHLPEAPAAATGDLDWLGTAGSASDLDPLVRRCLDEQWQAFWQDQPDYANVFERAVLDSWSPDTVATALGRTLHAAEQLISQARKRLFAYLSRCIS